jgi:Ca2+-binding RTX toxin-like protein
MPIPALWRSEYQVNTIQNTTSETGAEIAALADGRFAATWVSDDLAANDADIRFTIRLADGDAFSGFDDLLEAGSSGNDEFRGSVAGLSDGRMVFVWDTEAAGGGERDIYAEVRNADGDVFTFAFAVTPVSGTATDDQDLPTVLGLSNGNFMVAYRNAQPVDDAIRVRSFDISGNQLGGQTVSTTPAFDSLFTRPRMAELQNGNVVVTWIGGSIGNTQQKFSICAPDGSLVLAETDVNPEDALVESANYDVVALPDGNFVVLFHRGGDPNELQGRLFNQNGTALGARFDISSGEAFNPAATALQDGRFMVVYDDNGAIFGQMMFADGTPDGAQFTISDTASFESDAEIAALADGRVVVSWQSDQLGTSDIFAEIYDPREVQLSRSASSLADDWYGTALSDTMFMGTGNDTVHGGGAADFVYGEDGNDTIHGEDSDDRINGGNGIDTMIGGVGNDIYWVNSANDLTTELAGEGVDTVRATVSWTLASEVDKLYLDGTAANGTGNGLSNFIFGNASNNIINGLAGADRLYGYGGNDTYYVDSSGDLVYETIAGTPGGTDSVVSSVNHTLSANVENLTLSGGISVNATGNTLANTIAGNIGSNFIDGKEGNDTLSDVIGSDQFLFTTTLNASTNVDTILGFDPANDFLRLDDAIFTQIAPGYLAGSAFVSGTAATTAAHRIIYNPATGDVFYDSDGVGGVSQVRFADLLANPALTAADIFVF